MHFVCVCTVCVCVCVCVCAGLQNQLTGVKSKLLRAQAELHTLKTYKDKEYPVKALLIADMKREIIKLKDAQQVSMETV